MDIFSQETRSRIMSRIRGKDTKPEIAFRKALFKRGYRYSLKHRFKDIRCTPDLVLVSKRTCIFIDGCFWHKCPRCYRPPKSNDSYWFPKIESNLERDRKQNSYLQAHGWNVLRVWEHEITKDFDNTLKRVCQSINLAGSGSKSLKRTDF